MKCQFCHDHQPTAGLEHRCELSHHRLVVVVGEVAEGGEPGESANSSMSASAPSFASLSVTHRATLHPFVLPYTLFRSIRRLAMTMR